MLLDYQTLKLAHVSAVTLSGIGFALRFAGACAGATWVRSKPARTVPHIIDTVLLLSAIALAVTVGANPLEQDWLMVKIVALLIYISLGMVALNIRRRLAIRITAGFGALFMFSFIVSVAVSKHVTGFLSYF